MNLSRPFISRPVATTLLAIGIALAGFFAFVRLPVAPLPQIDFPTITVMAQMAGASPETMATSVASPLERHLGQIADVTEMTSQSAVGYTRITLQFGLNRDIDGAARDVQAAINAARADLPTSLRSNPTYHKYNPSDAPILVLALSSPTMTPGQLYDAASTVLQQALSQVDGVGEVDVSGSASPAVRVELEPQALFHYGIGLEDVRAALAAANAHSPKGAIEFGPHTVQLYTNDQATRAAQYKDLVIAYRNGAAVKLSDVAEVVDSVEDLRNLGLSNGKRSVLVILYRQPGANIVETVDRVIGLIPTLKASLPAAVDVEPVVDRSTTIRSSLKDTERTLLIAVALVVSVVFVFLRNWRATLIPSVAVPISIIGTFGAMYLLGYSIDNLSLMALIIATGFVVDDAIVVLENISRHIEAGVPPMRAAYLGASEVGFTVMSISISLVAVFLPILLMGGIVGRIFREFAVTLSLAIAVSLAVSLTVTPMMCSRLLRPAHERREEGPLARRLESGFARLAAGYGRTLGWALAHPAIVIAILAGTVALNVYLYVAVPKGFFPQQDTGRLIGGIMADQSTSFQLMKTKFAEMMRIVQANQNVDTVTGFTGGRQTNSGFMFISLKPKGKARKASADQVIAQLRGPLSHVAGAQTFLQPVQDIRVGGRMSNAQYQFTLLGDSSADLDEWTPKLTEALKRRAELIDVNSDQQQGGLESMVTIDRRSAARYKITPSQIDNTLYDAFGQRQVSTIYNPLNQYHVVMEVAPRYWQSPDMLKQIYVSTSGGSAGGTQSTNAVAGTVTASAAASGGSGSTGTSAATIATDAARNLATNSIAASGKSSASTGSAVSTSAETMVPLSAIASFGPGNTPLSVNHQGSFVASTISFNLPPGKSLSDATRAIEETMADIGMPGTIHGSFSGTAQAFQQSVSNMPLLILAALAAVYIVLGILYESYIHPVTILSTLPSAGVGALLALLLFKTEFSIIALIGVILLIGIVKKNAIMMIDFAIEASRQGMSSVEAIRSACLLRFRPILMTTCAALLGALPLAFGTGEGAELRSPLGISIVGGLIVSQMLTLYTTPVVYLYMDRLRVWWDRRRASPAVRGQEH
ncbi:efflux RND transporter permease subunit [Trinickia caryophylli]|uniref:Multidrug efflux pump n=1 Tax=Trinickia caryophylli TaxID=28094 RepID=A0A1X7DXN5_TRICW|nr:efflux RND transporter permease subunit [Trinickia caryophylli]PMS14172.1 nodulation protein [Trinickia caryophylli]TRX17870.1 MMPL family transporter [Trinickia caryophylli]WQE11360.1 efflux RND transporter permease subunit [Trinickia caryophylli]SMF23588.1 multidrug efflux pump [Trinickia caryophylli]GLU32518.1 transport system membrane protein [Trinickia caryophylli]